MTKFNKLSWVGDIEQYFIGHQAEEIFKTRLYAPYLEGKKDAVVVDCGGNLGLFSLYASKYAKQIYCIEPDPELFECIQETIKDCELKNVKAIKKAIYIENKEFDFFRNPNRTMNSLHTAVAHQDYPPIKVSAITLDKLFEEEKIEHCDLLKIDIEGSEFEVLSSDSFAKVASKIETVVGETHQWGARNIQQLIDVFKELGFIFQSVPHDAQLFVAHKPQKVGTLV